MAQLKPGTTIGGRNIVQELDSHKNDKVAHIDYAVASGTNTYTANIQGITALVEGLSVKIKFQNANTGASTLNINGLGAKEIRKSNGNTLSNGNIKAGQICHLVYTGSVFQLLGEGGEYGTATPAEVLKGYTIGTEDGVKKGTLELTGNATTGDVLTGKTFYNTNAKSKQTGTMPNHGSKIFTPSRNIQTGTSGYYSSITVNPIPSNYYGSGDSIPANQFSDYILPIKWMKIDTGYSSITGGRFVGNRIINYAGGSYGHIVYSYDPDTGDYVSASLNSYDDIVAISMIDGMSSGALVYTTSLDDYCLTRVSVSTTSISVGSAWMYSDSYIYAAPCDSYIYYASKYTSGGITYYRYGRASSSSSCTVLFEKSFLPAGRLHNFYADHTDGVLFVSVAGSHNKIYKFDFSGNTLASLNYTGNFMAMEIDVVNNHLYVCDGNTLKKMDYNFSTIWSISVSNMGISDAINTSLRYFYKIGNKIYLNGYILNADNGNILYNPSNETITLPPGMSGSLNILVAPDLSYKIISGSFGTVRLLNAIKLK